MIRDIEYWLRQSVSVKKLFPNSLKNHGKLTESNLFVLFLVSSRLKKSLVFVN